MLLKEIDINYLTEFTEEASAYLSDIGFTINIEKRRFRNISIEILPEGDFFNWLSAKDHIISFITRMNNEYYFQNFENNSILMVEYECDKFFNEKESNMTGSELQWSNLSMNKSINNFKLFTIRKLDQTKKLNTIKLKSIKFIIKRDRY